ncbi:hypothetical protein [Alishewanella sp. HL-SH06]|uniref:hypothetical protein n=1 Tax=Alishewanella sp. HL-SH06 TaxID=3461144 RepID=UPI004042BB2F
MFWPLIKDSITAKALILLGIALLFWLFGYQSLFFTALLFSLELFFFSKNNQLSDDEYTYSKDILRLFAVQEQKLRVGMDSAPLRSIKQITLWQEDNLGFIDFDLNGQLRVQYKFRLEQMQPLQQLLQQALPDTEFVNGFKS